MLINSDRYRYKLGRKQKIINYNFVIYWAIKLQKCKCGLKSKWLCRLLNRHKSIPDFRDISPQTAELTCRCFGRFFLEAELMYFRSISKVGFFEKVGHVFFKYTCFSQGFENADIVGPHQEFHIFTGF